MCSGLNTKPTAILTEHYGVMGICSTTTKEARKELNRAEVPLFDPEQKRKRAGKIPAPVVSLLGPSV